MEVDILLIINFFLKVDLICDFNVSFILLEDGAGV